MYLMYYVRVRSETDAMLTELGSETRSSGCGFRFGFGSDSNVAGIGTLHPLGTFKR
jgi:hypothetical protein